MLIPLFVRSCGRCLAIEINMAKVIYARGLWGMPEGALITQCRRIADAGFDAVEAFIPLNEPAWQESWRTPCSKPVCS